MGLITARPFFSRAGGNLIGPHHAFFCLGDGRGIGLLRA